MNGRAVFNFALQDVPKQIKRTLASAELTVEDVELFLLHQGSRFMLENTIKRAGIPAEGPYQTLRDRQHCFVVHPDPVGNRIG